MYNRFIYKLNFISINSQLDLLVVLGDEQFAKDTFVIGILRKIFQKWELVNEKSGLGVLQIASGRS